jgi:AraC family ethanolamine operon transcriptional activator
MGQFAALRTQKIKGFEELNEVVLGTRREIVQLERGKIAGELTHASIGDLPIDVASFNLGIRTRGGLHRDRIGIGMLAASDGRAVRAFYESHSGDVLVTPPGSELENRYYGGASIIVVMASVADIESSFGTEGPLSDPSLWWKNHFKGNAQTVSEVIPRLQSLLGRLGSVSLSAEAAEYWKRAVIEAMTANVVVGMPSERDGPLPSALKIVRQVEEYLDVRAADAVHISEICSQLHLSRRTLHRAFHEALGVGPIAFLRGRRLCAVHTALRASQDVRTISDIAMHYGFQNLGRFAGYYRQLFGEYPSETRQPHGPQLDPAREAIHLSPGRGISKAKTAEPCPAVSKPMIAG